MSVADKTRGGQKDERVRVIDWSPDGGTTNNDFLLVSQFSITGALYTCRPELVKLSRELTDEETRHVRENLTEEELAIFDILTRPGPELGASERKEVKKVAAHLLTRLKQIQNLDWRQTVQARAKIKETIEEELDALPEAYTRPMFSEKCSRVFEHVYETRAS